MARVVAPLALLAAVLALALVVGSASTGGDGEERVQRAGDGRASDAGGGNGERGERPPRRYTVEPGDTLSGIAERFEVAEEEILELNPDLDPQALATGQELRLR